MDDIAKELGLKARAFKASRLKRKDKPSNEVLYLWFVSQVGLARKKDVQAFDVWLRSSDGVTPYPSPNGFQNSYVFPWRGTVGAGFEDTTSYTFYPHDTKELQVSLKGMLLLKENVTKLP